MKIKYILSAIALAATTAAMAQQVTISPIPQSVAWGDKAYDSAGATYTLQGADQADADAVRALKAKCQVTDGAGGVTIVIGERGDAAVAEYASEIPEKAEGYLLKVEPGKVVIAGHDGAGTFYGVQSFLQVAAQPQVMSVTVKDWPDIVERGVVEGFYGNNWSQTDRIRQFQFYGANKMNVYIYGPKDDPYHRGRWRENYPTAQAEKMRELARVAKENKVKFVWAVHPGNDIKWNATDEQNVVNKLESMYALGIRSFAVFFDDISGEGTSGIKQAQLMNYVTDNFVRKHDDVDPLIICPTEYNRGWSGNTYHFELRDNMYEEVRIMWTGNSVVDFINKSDLEWINPRIGRKAYIWLNYPVTDYCGRHLLMGPTFGDDLNIEDMVSGYTSNPMEYAEASMVSLYSVADYTWNMGAYDSNASWERAIKYLMPERAEAFRLFCQHNVDLGVNTHGLRRTNESTEFKGVATRFNNGIAKGYDASLVSEMKAQFDLMVDAADVLLANTDQPELTAEITPWVQVMKHTGVRGQAVIDMYTCLNDKNPEAFVEAYLTYLENTRAQDKVMSRDFDGSIMRVNPIVAEVVVQPFIKQHLGNLIAEYRQNYDYRLDVFPAELLEKGEYYIKYQGKYLTNTNDGGTGGNPTFQANIDDVNPTRQHWTIQVDMESGRYKIVNAKDSRYLNEKGDFTVNNSTNPYEAAWHTYNLYRLNGKYAIQNGGSAGNKFWTANSTRISTSTENTLNTDRFIFEIVPVSGAIEYPMIETSKQYVIRDESGKYLTNTNPNGSGSYPQFRELNVAQKQNQLWKFTIDSTKKRYKLVSAKDNRYVNELGDFGVNAFYNDWNTYNLTEMGGLFSIQNAESAGTNYWVENNGRIEPKNVERAESFQFNITTYEEATDIQQALNDGTNIQCYIDGENLRVESAEPVQSITIRSVDGKTLRTVQSAPQISLFGLQGSIYLATVQTATATKTLKLAK